MKILFDQGTPSPLRRSLTDQRGLDLHGSESSPSARPPQDPNGYRGPHDNVVAADQRQHTGCHSGDGGSADRRFCRSSLRGRVRHRRVPVALFLQGYGVESPGGCARTVAAMRSATTSGTPMLADLDTISNAGPETRSGISGLTTIRRVRFGASKTSPAAG